MVVESPEKQEQQRTFYKEKLGQRALTVETAAEALNAINMAKEFREKIKAASFKVTLRAGCNIQDTVQAINELLKTPENSHIRIIISSTLASLSDQKNFVKRFEETVKRNLSKSELERIYVFPTHRDIEHVKGLKKFLGVE